MIFYFLGLAVTVGLGTAVVRLLSRTVPGPLAWVMGAAVGFGINGFLVFWIQLVLGIQARIVPVVAAGLIWMIALGLQKRGHFSHNPFDFNWLSRNGPILGIALLAVVWEAHRYPLGGWDAWSCWNLKARFIDLGREHWKDMLDPVLWRSNTHYPLLLPCITVWFWDLSFSWPGAPMWNAIVFYVLTASVLLFGLQWANVSRWVSWIGTAAIFLLPLNVTLGASQYSDILVALYLLLALICFWQEEWILCGLFLGFLSFTKTEGLTAAVILAGLIFWARRFQDKSFWTTLAASLLPVIVFTLWIAPHNEAFINGLSSSQKPSDLNRLGSLLALFGAELLSFKWNGIWLWLAVAIALTGKDLIVGKSQTITLFLAAFVAVLVAYYQINTFFEIGWWVQNTLHRVLFFLLPSVVFWVSVQKIRAKHALHAQASFPNGPLVQPGHNEPVN